MLTTFGPSLKAMTDAAAPATTAATATATTAATTAAAAATASTAATSAATTAATTAKATTAEYAYTKISCAMPIPDGYTHYSWSMQGPHVRRWCRMEKPPETADKEKYLYTSIQYYMPVPWGHEHWEWRVTSTHVTRWTRIAKEVAHRNESENEESIRGNASHEDRGGIADAEAT